MRFEVDGLTTGTTRVLTVPDSSFTLVGIDLSQTLTNKTLQSPTVTGTLTMTGLGTLEHLAFSVVNSVGPFTVYLDDVDQLCDIPDYGDFDGDAEVDGADYDIFSACMNGPNVPITGGCAPGWRCVWSA